MLNAKRRTDGSICACNVIPLLIHFDAFQAEDMEDTGYTGVSAAAVAGIIVATVSVEGEHENGSYYYQSQNRSLGRILAALSPGFV